MYVCMLCLSVQILKETYFPHPPESPPMVDSIRTPRTSNLVQYWISPITNNGMVPGENYLRENRLMRQIVWEI